MKKMILGLLAVGMLLISLAAMADDRSAVVNLTNGIYGYCFFVSPELPAPAGSNLYHTSTPWTGGNPSDDTSDAVNGAFDITTQYDDGADGAGTGKASGSDTEYVAWGCNSYEQFSIVLHRPTPPQGTATGTWSVIFDNVQELFFDASGNTTRIQTDTIPPNGVEDRFAKWVVPIQLKVKDIDMTSVSGAWTPGTLEITNMQPPM